MRKCPCRLHRLPRHPSTYSWLPGLASLFDLCWCECDHAPDEERWAA